MRRGGLAKLDIAFALWAEIVAQHSPIFELSWACVFSILFGPQASNAELGERLDQIGVSGSTHPMALGNVVSNGGSFLHCAIFTNRLWPTHAILPFFSARLGRIL